jgi:hypothetical protein
LVYAHHGDRFAPLPELLAEIFFHFSDEESRWLIHPELLVSRASQRRLQPPLFLVPIGIFGLQLLLDRLDFGAQRGGPSRVLLLRFFKSRLRLVDGLLPAFALLLPSRR